MINEFHSIKSAAYSTSKILLIMWQIYVFATAVHVVVNKIRVELSCQWTVRIDLCRAVKIGTIRTISNILPSATEIEGDFGVSNGCGGFNEDISLMPTMIKTIRDLDSIQWFAYTTSNKIDKFPWNSLFGKEIRKYSSKIPFSVHGFI